MIDRLAWWYDLPREWLKKIALMDDVYLLNNPFTFQAMEKHSAYCAMIRLGLKVPETWLSRTRRRRGASRFESATDKFEEMASRYNASFDLDEIAEQVGYPLFMKPFDGGQWVGVTRISGRGRAARRYDESGERLMHFQAAVDGLRRLRAQPLDRRRDDGHALSTPTGRCTTATQVAHDFLSAETGRRGGDDLTARERLLPLGVQLVRDAHQGRRGVPDRLRERVSRRRADEPALLLPVGDQGARPLVARSASATGRPMRIDQDTRRYFEIGDRDDLSLRGEARASTA